MPGKQLEHLAIIMDGNRRWAKSQGLPAFEGHRQGTETFKKIGEACLERGIKVLTVFAFSTENWSRSKEEVTFLFNIFEEAIRSAIETFKNRNVRLKVIGRVEDLPESLRKVIFEVEKATENNSASLLQLAINYGGQPEIVDAVKKIVRQGARPDQITPEIISANLYNPGVPPPDLIIRTSGEQRLSGFLLWQSDYSELYFTAKHWPEFSVQDLDAAINEYDNRQRRFGK